jgi:hypothetical protein
LLTAAGNQAKVEKTVEAERFVLRDRNGKKRAELLVEEGRVVHSYFDRGGNPRLQMGVEDNDMVEFVVLNKQGKIRFDLSVDPDGEVSLCEYGAENDGKPRIVLRVDRGGNPAQSFIDNKGEERIGLVIAPDNSAGLTIWGKNKKVIFKEGE